MLKTFDKLLKEVTEDAARPKFTTIPTLRTTTTPAEAEDEETKAKVPKLQANPPPPTPNYRYWKFTVHCSTYPGETVAVTGDCDQLGNWKHNSAFILERVTENSNGLVAKKQDAIWTGECWLPRNVKVKFRYFVCMILDNANSGNRLFIMRRWESNSLPRIINELQVECGLDQFGFIEASVFKMEHGWLTSESIIQFKISNSPLRFWRKKHQNGKISLKMIPLNLSRTSSTTEFPDSLNQTNSLQDEQQSTTITTTANECWPLIEVAVINEEEYEFIPQTQFGRIYNENEILVFQAQVLHLENVAYMIDFYMTSLSGKVIEPSNSDEIPLHIGFCHILPVNLKSSTGTIIQPITGMRQESIGQIHIEYVVVKPLEDSPCDLSVSYSRHWRNTWTGLDIGHRGSGNSQQKPANKLQQCSVIRENTIASLQKAANHGADFVEFDVQLSKDLVPVLFHDFHVNIGLNRKQKTNGTNTNGTDTNRTDTNGTDTNGTDTNGTKPTTETTPPTNLLTTLRLPMHSLTVAQLHELRISHEHEEPSENPLDEDGHEPFPTLESALNTIATHVGFNIEMKWPMKLKDGSFELENPVELNTFLDIVLKTVLEFGGKRRIVFSSFHPDICLMVRLKQNKYPILFLTQGVTTKYPEYNDPRTQTTSVAINFALFSGILGLNMHTEDILRDPNFVQKARSHGLVTFCWGDDNNSSDTIKYLKQLGLHGVVYDRIDEHLMQKQSIFLTMNEEDNDFLQIASGLESTAS